MTTRREFLKLLVGGTALGVIGGVSAYKDSEVMVKKLSLTYKSLPKEFHQFRICFLTDIHDGPYLKDAWLDQTKAILLAEKYDLLILGGDYINVPEFSGRRGIFPFQTNRFPNKYGKTLANIVFHELAVWLKTIEPEFGTVAVFGNHDRWVAPYECENNFARLGIKLLCNEGFQINKSGASLKVFGTDDFWTGVPDISRAHFSENQFRVVVSHNPDYISELYNAGQINFHLGLSGHTHGGQICFPMIGGVYHNVQDSRFESGLQQITPECFVYTSNGIGVVEVPYRFNCPPEVTFVELNTST